MNKMVIVWILNLIIFNIKLNADSTEFYRLPYEQPIIRVNSYTSQINSKNCTFQITYPILESMGSEISESNKAKINKYLKKVFFDARSFNNDVACNSKFRKADLAYYMEVDFFITYNKGNYLSLIYNVTGYPAGAKEPSVTKRGLTFNLKNGYTILFDELFSKKSGYKMNIEAIIVESLLQNEFIEVESNFDKYRKKSYEYALFDTDLGIILDSKNEKEIFLKIPYSSILKILNSEIFLN
jgi:hypothetical protein